MLIPALIPVPYGSYDLYSLPPGSMPETSVLPYCHIDTIDVWSAASWLYTAGNRRVSYGGVNISVYHFLRI